jgi:hypothetical protein
MRSTHDMKIQTKIEEVFNFEAIKIKDKETSCAHTNFCEIPLFVTQRTYTASLQPALNTIKMEDMSTVTEGYRETVVIRIARVGLIFNTWLIK